MRRPSNEWCGGDKGVAQEGCTQAGTAAGRHRGSVRTQPWTGAEEKSVSGFVCLDDRPGDAAHARDANRSPSPICGYPEVLELPPRAGALRSRRRHPAGGGTFTATDTGGGQKLCYRDFAVLDFCRGWRRKRQLVVHAQPCPGSCADRRFEFLAVEVVDNVTV